ncbi:MAG: hypothetical protein IKM59_01105 [Oscillospiraceae bacterium]|nr:hypothetical protein [Oscillospiraceae bacterium]
MKEYYTHGSEAYAPIPIELPSHLPEEPEKQEALIPEEKKSVSPFTVVVGAVVLLLFFGLLFSMMRLFEVRSERAELQRQKQQLQTLQDQLIAEYEGSIDMEAVEKRAEELGMHIPYADQVQYVQIELPDLVAETVEEIQIGLVEALQSMTRDMQSYFAP